MKTLKSKTSPIKFFVPILFILFGLSLMFGQYSSNIANDTVCPLPTAHSLSLNCSDKARLVSSDSSTTLCNESNTSVTYNCGNKSGPYCGGPTERVYTTINFGCLHKGNPILDLLFAIIRFMSAGVGIVVIGSIIVGGLQYIGSRGEPQSTSLAIERIRSSVIALVIFIFGYAILNYLIPGGLLH